uniref:Uterocalin-like n=1 Tax=Callorhinus ursinus TaxID=34884 RepID=A0A3Q7NB12_CALUR|nr:uterocalin-like [Callorhinus ursinus]
MPTSARQVNGDWFSIAQASSEPKLLWKDSHMMFFVRKIHTLESTGDMVTQGWGSLPWNGTHTSNVWRDQAPPSSVDAGHSVIFPEEVAPSRFIFCIHNHWHGKETVVVNLLSRTPPASWDVMQTFKNYCKSHGISPANIINLTRTDCCLHA